MKIALCLSGQPRNIEEGYKSIFANFIEPYDCDVFIHTWSNGFPQERIEKLKELYKPVSMQVDKCHTPVCDYSNLRYVYGPQKIYDMSSQYDSIARANKLRNKYEEETNIHYDCVIRCRMDLHFNKRVYLEKYSMDVLHTRLENVCKYNGLHSDFGFGNKNIMDQYAKCFENIIPIYQRLHRENPLNIPENLMLASEIILGQTIRYVCQVPVEEHPGPDDISFYIIRN